MSQVASTEKETLTPITSFQIFCNRTAHRTSFSGKFRASSLREERGFPLRSSLTSRRGSPRASSMCGLLLQKVCTDCLGNFSWSLFVDSKVVKLGNPLCFRSREDRCKPLHGQRYPFDIAFPPIHEQNVCGYLSVVFITTVQPSHFLMLAQIFLEDTQPLLALVRTHDKRKQELHIPMRYFAYALRTQTDEELDKGAGIVLLGKFLLVARHPAHWDGPIKRDTRFVHGNFGE